MIPSGLPKWTLGWQVLDWGSQMLGNPDGKAKHQDKGDPWVYSDEQALFILWFYAIDVHGQFIYRNAVLERPKGWGKSPLLAAICCTEFMGPCRFSHFERVGALGELKPVAVPAPTALVQIAAISDSQAENTYEICREMMLSGPIRKYFPSLDVMLAKSTYPGSRKLEKVTASPRGREGNRPSFIVMDETHLWIPAEQGPQLYEALCRNLVKGDNRWIETTNAPVPGEESVAELTHEAYERMVGGKTLDQALLFDTREVAIKDIYDKEKAYEALRYVYGDAADPETGWLNLDRIWAEINDPRTREPVARRFYFNQRVRPPSSWLKYEDWMRCHKPRLKLKNGDQIALGIKGTVTYSATAIVGCRLSDGALFNLGLWEKPLGIEAYGPKRNNRKEGTKGYPTNTSEKWECNWNEVDSRVRNLLYNYEIPKILADPVSRRDVISQWYADYPKVVEEFWFSNRGKFARIVEQFEQAVKARRVSWENQDICRHVLNSHVEEVPGGHVIRPETQHSDRYISMAQAAVLAVEAAALAIQDGALSEDNDYFFSM